MTSSTETDYCGYCGGPVGNCPCAQASLKGLVADLRKENAEKQKYILELEREVSRLKTALKDADRCIRQWELVNNIGR